jgi:hypothetical protein
MEQQLTMLIELYMKQKNRWDAHYEQKTVIYKAMKDVREIQTSVIYLDGREDYTSKLMEGLDCSYVDASSRMDAIHSTMMDLIHKFDDVLMSNAYNITDNYFWNLSEEEMIDAITNLETKGSIQ